MKLFKKILDRNKALYWGLIITFGILYFFTAFISWYHSIVFFHITNAVWLAVIFSLVAEIGQAGILFAILLTKNKQRFLSWTTMIILTALQVIGNVVASYKFIDTGSGESYIYFQKAILFWVQAADTEMIKTIIAWISGSLLPIIALSMTGLVATNLQLKDQPEEADYPTPTLQPSTPKEELPNDDSDLSPVDLTNEVPDQLKTIREDLRQQLLKDALTSTRETLEEKNAKKDEETGFKIIEPSVEIPLQKTNVLESETEVDTSYLDEEVSNLVPEQKERDLIDHSFIVPTDDIDESGIGGEPTPEQEKQVSEFINKEKSINNPLGIDAEAEITKMGEELTQKQFEKSDFIITSLDAIAQEKAKSQFDKDFIIPEPIKKKRGRPPKEIKKEVAEPKKEQELLQKEEVEVPQKPKENEKPLNNEIDTLIKGLDKAREDYDKSVLLVPPELRTPYLNGGVEVIDGKAVPKDEKIKKN